jgi:S-DNA-T family DNA segregation ATPase FtsK/SpoIIIE
MGRHKKNFSEAETETKNSGFNLAPDVRRGVTAVFLFSLALLLTLGFFGKAGIAGEYLNKFTGSAIGWGKLFFPIFLFMAGFVLILKKGTNFYVWKILGLIVTLLGIVGFMHWFVPQEGMLEAAKKGLGGGFLGYAVAFVSIKFLGSAGSLIFITAIFLSGFIVAFNFSIINFFERLLNLWRKEKTAEGEALSEKKESVPLSLENKKTEEIAKEEKDSLKTGENSNIGKVEFVEGPNDFLQNKSTGKNAQGFSAVKKNKNQASFSERNAKANSGQWKFPPLALLEKGRDVPKGGDLDTNAEIIEKTLRHFGIEVEKEEVKIGPSVTQYSFRPAVGVKVSRILALQNDLALALAASSIRIEAPIPGRSVIGIEVPNKDAALVRLRDVLESSDFTERESNLTLALGEDVSGKYIFGNLEKMPHLMIAGSTGTGKSVCVNSLITTLLYQNSPEDLKLIMVDPKRVELSFYNGIPHLLCNVIVENSKVLNSLKWAVGEMERRYKLLQDMSSVNIVSFNEKIKSGKKRKITNPDTGEVEEESLSKLPYIVIIIDEVADLMGSHGREVESAIVRLAQMARAVGIHLVVSTQRPSVEIITGLIKANITNRIAFQVASQIDSRTILDMAGAEKLLGKGDMLYLSSASPKPKRIQGVFIEEAETRKVVEFIKNQKFEEKVNLPEDKVDEIQFGKNLDANFSNKGDISEFRELLDDEEDSLYEAAKEEVIRSGKASASLLQRRLRVGYARAARLLDVLESKEIIGPADGAKAREVFIKAETDNDYADPKEDQEKRDKWQV